jgi:hypothetical protein
METTHGILRATLADPPYAFPINLLWGSPISVIGEMEEIPIAIPQNSTPISLFTSGTLSSFQSLSPPFVLCPQIGHTMATIALSPQLPLGFKLSFKA